MYSQFVLENILLKLTLDDLEIYRANTGKHYLK